MSEPSDYDYMNRRAALTQLFGNLEPLLPSGVIGLIQITEEPETAILIDAFAVRLQERGYKVKKITGYRTKGIEEVGYFLYIYPVVTGERHIYSYLLPPPPPPLSDRTGISQMIHEIQMEGWAWRQLLGASAEGRGTSLTFYVCLQEKATGKIMVKKEIETLSGKEMKL